MNINRLRGLKDLVQSAVENASTAIERVHKDTARRPFQVLESIPAVRVPASGIHLIHDQIVSSVHGVVRLTTRVIGETVGVALDAIESASPGSAEDGARQPRGSSPGGADPARGSA